MSTKTEQMQASLLQKRHEFPVLTNGLGKDVHYLDSAATTQKPNFVLDVMDRFYREEYGTVRRGVYKLSEKATYKFEEVRQLTADFLGAESPNEIVFTSGTTQSINLVAYSWGLNNINSGDEILITHMEHHANILPWQMVAEAKGAKLRAAPITDEGELDFEEYLKMLNPKTKLVAVTHVSNALGTINPIKKIIEAAHQNHSLVLVDGAQSTPHIPLDLKSLGADFFAFSGHKIYGPSGIGVLFGRYDLLEKMPPYQRGGEMIVSVELEKSEFRKPPTRFEAGTPPIAEVIGMGAALEYLQKTGLENIANHESALQKYAEEQLTKIEGIRLIGTAKEKAGIVSFIMEQAHPHDLGTILDGENIAIRAGHHCAQPLMKRYGLAATARASFGVYNDYSDVDALVAGLRKASEVFS